MLNFGQPAPIDIRVSGPNNDEAYASPRSSRMICKRCPASSTRMSSRFRTRRLSVDVDRALATQLGLDQVTTANNVLVYTNSSAQTAPNFWLDPRDGVSYPLVVQMPTLSDRLDAGPLDLAGHRRIMGRSRASF